MRNPSYSLRYLLLIPAMRLTQEWLNRATDVDLRFRASLSPQLALWVVDYRLHYEPFIPLSFSFSD
jgi:hypothetical protein